MSKRHYPVERSYLQMIFKVVEDFFFAATITMFILMGALTAFAVFFAIIDAVSK